MLPRFPDDSLSNRLAQRVTQLGIRSGETVIDYSSATEKIRQEPRASGNVVDKDTFQVVNKDYGDDIYRKLVNQYQDELTKRSFFKYANTFAGIVGLSPFDIINSDNDKRFHELAANIRDALSANLKARQISLESRQAILNQALRQQAQLTESMKSLSDIYTTMAPTVARWYWLASMTGFPPVPKGLAQASIIVPYEEPTDDNVIPYWLLARYIRHQYARPVKNKNDLISSAGEDVYWEPLSDDYKWTMEFLQEYRTALTGLLSINDDVRRLAIRDLYLTFRDAILGSGLRLASPFGKESQSNEAGRYHHLPRIMKRVQKSLAKTLTVGAIKERAATRSEVIAQLQSIPEGSTQAATVRAVQTDVNADAVVFTKTTTDGIELSEEPGTLFQKIFTTRWCPNLWYTLTGTLIPAAITDYLETEVGKAVIAQWGARVDNVLHAMGGISLDGIVHLLDFWQLVGSANSKAVFESPVFDTVFPDKTGTDSPLLKNAVLANGLRTKVDETDLFKTTYGNFLIYYPKPKSDARWLLKGPTMNPVEFKIEVGKTNQSLIDLEIYNEGLDLVGQPALETDVFNQVRTFVLITAVAWSRLMQDPRVRNNILGFLKISLLAHDATTTTDWVSKLDNHIYVKWTNKYGDQLDAFASFPHVAPHFYRELFRSTMVGDFSRTNIRNRGQSTNDPDKALLLTNNTVETRYKAGDIDPTLLRYYPIYSTNVSAFKTTWEPFYANVLTAPTNSTLYWRDSFRILVDTAYTAISTGKTNTETDTVLESLWKEITGLHPEVFQMADLPVPDGVPLAAMLQLNLPALPSLPLVTTTKTTKTTGENNEPTVTVQEVSQEDGAAQIVQNFASRFQRTVVTMRAQKNAAALIPTQMKQFVNTARNKRTNAVPPIELLYAMVAFVFDFYPSVQKDVMALSTDLEKTVTETDTYVRSVATGSRDLARSDIRNIVDALDLPDVQWQMQSLLTGRINFTSYFTASLDIAYSQIQNKAFEDFDTETQRNGFNKRGRMVTADRSYAHLYNVPLDVLTCNTEPDDAGGNATRDYLDTRVVSEGLLATLRADMCACQAQWLVALRLDVPDQYKVIEQYKRSPVFLQGAMVRIRSYHFTALGNRAWKVERH